MKQFLLLIVLFTTISSCALLRRDLEAEETSESEQEESHAVKSPEMDNEVSRLTTKVSALETKLDVLTATLEKMQMKKAQPIIEAETEPQKSMSAPVLEPMNASSESDVAEMESEKSPSTLATTSAQEQTPFEPLFYGESESDFKSAMTLFQNGKNIEAASRFSVLAKKYPKHPLASHALYWAGEANAREKQWSMAIQNWEQLEKLYPTSTYVADAMAGLSRAYEMQGDTTKSVSYKNTVLQSFPNSPVALNLHTKGSTAQTATSSAAPARKEEIPEFHQPEDGGSENEYPVVENE